MIYEGKKKIWSDYQKEIPDDHWYYVRSCIRQNFFPASERMFTEITRGVLGRDIYETPHHTTCGGIAYHCDTIPQETAMTIVARQFALMTEAGYENYAPSCITSFGNYAEILETWREYPELEAKIREDLFVHIESLSHAQLNNIPVGKLVTRVTNDTHAISMMFTNLIVNLVKNCFIVIGILIAMLCLNYALTLMVLCFVPFIVLFTVVHKVSELCN